MHTITEKKRLRLESYLHYIISDNLVIDEICLVILAKMYKIHIGILYRSDYWTTNKSKDIDTCDIVFAYRGKLNFSYTMQLEEVSLQKDVILSYLDRKDHEHVIDMEEESFINKGPETIACTKWDVDKVQQFDYYRDGFSPQTFIFSESDVDLNCCDYEEPMVSSPQEPVVQTPSSPSPAPPPSPQEPVVIAFAIPISMCEPALWVVLTLCSKHLKVILNIGLRVVGSTQFMVTSC